MTTTSKIKEGNTATFNSKPILFDNDEAAAYVGIKPRTFEVWRCVKRHAIPYIKVGRLVKYRQADLDAWLESRRINDTK